jgi:hypothetical protein
MDLGFKREIQRRIGPLVWRTRVEYPHERPDNIADKVEPQLTPPFPIEYAHGGTEKGPARDSRSHHQGVWRTAAVTAASRPPLIAKTLAWQILA